MKRIILITLMAALLFAACDPNEEIYKELDKEVEPYNEDIEYTLAEGDYATIADLIRDNKPADSLYADFIEGREYFTDSIKASGYVPYLLADQFPALNAGSSALVTFNYNGEMPADYSTYTGAEEITLNKDHYKMAGPIVDATDYFSPEDPASVYLPEILNSARPDAEDGSLYLVEYKASDVTPKIDSSVIEEAVYWNENLEVQADGLGAFSAFNLTGDTTWFWQEYGDGCATMTGYHDGKSSDNEDWLISEAIDLSGATNPNMAFRHAINFMDDGYWDQVSVWISTDFDGSDVEGATWTKVEVPNWTSGGSWDFEESGRISLEDYAGEAIYVGFKYLSNVDNACTWEVGDLRVYSSSGAKVTGEEPKTFKTFYTKEEGEWKKDDYAYHVNAEDYDAMGAPGEYNNFSDSDKPEDYLPKLLNQKFPLLGEGAAKLMVYNYYTGSKTLTLASEYTQTKGTWEPDYKYVTQETQQFLYSGKVSRWVFDPSVSITMTNADYGIIVNYVESEIDADYLDSYGTTESYYGASSYYGNFDGREATEEHSGWASDTFDSWEGAITAAFTEAYLPNKFPQAQAQVNGVDVFYTITFDAYAGGTSTYTIKFQCTQSAPNPEFELVKGPNMQ